MVSISDAIGHRGESLFRVLISAFHGKRGPLFHPQFLGDKWEGADFIVELAGAGQVVPYFFAQVKATREGYTGKTRRLKVRLPAARLRRLAAYPAPTYVVGIDEAAERGYIISASGKHPASLSAMSTLYPINAENREVLWAEVRDYWAACNRPMRMSRFMDPGWR